jgi:hypothetical protein
MKTNLPKKVKRMKPTMKMNWKVGGKKHRKEHPNSKSQSSRGRKKRLIPNWKALVIRAILKTDQKQQSSGQSTNGLVNRNLINEY